MSHQNHLSHYVHLAHRADEEGHGKWAGVMFLIIGFFLAPMLIGIPLMCYGIYKLCK